MEKEAEFNASFPADFLWGAATSSYQVEGETSNGIENDWSEAARSTSSGRARVPAAGRACDHYNLYEKDFDIAKSLGHNAHRLSIEWARIEPEEGRFDDNEIEHYRKVLQALKDRGIEPMVTLWHFTLPIWFAKMGGFENRKSPEIFARYCGYVVERLAVPAESDSATTSQGGIGVYPVKFWITMNEPMVYFGMGYLKGNWPPFKKNIFRFIKVVDNLVMSHNIAYRKIKTISQSLQAGIAHNIKGYGHNKNPLNHLLSILAIFFHNRWFLSKVKQSQDFIGLNYYFHRGFGEKIKHERSDMGWEIYPKGIYNVLVGLKQYKKPIYITENGIADAQDTKRAKFIKDHLYWVKRAVDDGVDARGYLYWSLLDNFEWAEGFTPRFGLVEVDYETMERRIRPSAYEYKKICESNSLTWQ